jgi:hypothetical protein
MLSSATHSRWSIGLRVAQRALPWCEQCRKHVGACGTKIADDNLNWRNRRWNFEKYALGLSACVNLFQVLSTKAAGLRLCPNAEQIQPKKGRGGGSGGTGGCSKNLDDVEPNMSVEE